MVVGFKNDSDSDSAGNSIGKPPAIRMPRLTSSTRDLKCMWQGRASDQVLRIAMIGRSFHSSGAKPICIARERWPKALRSSGANQRALRSVSGLFFLSVMATPVRDPAHGPEKWGPVFPRDKRPGAFARRSCADKKVFSQA